jgi:hypothetical protein
MNFLTVWSMFASTLYAMRISSARRNMQCLEILSLTGIFVYFPYLLSIFPPLMFILGHLLLFIFILVASMITFKVTFLRVLYPSFVFCVFQ